jgi:formylglycine-generating enzyme required for sulfatase activity
VRDTFRGKVVAELRSEGRTEGGHMKLRIVKKNPICPRTLGFVFLVAVLLTALLFGRAYGSTLREIVERAKANYTAGQDMVQLIQQSMASAQASGLSLDELAAPLTETFLVTGVELGQDGVSLAGYLAAHMFWALLSSGVDEAVVWRGFSNAIQGIRAAAAQKNLNADEVRSRIERSLANAVRTKEMKQRLATIVLNAYQEAPAETYRASPEIWQEPTTGLEFVWVPGGCYQMGCGSWTGSCADDENPVHEVCVDGFYMGKYEVTQGQWKRVMVENPSSFKEGDNYPVEGISWNNAREFINRLNAINQGRYAFRLPTEAEWEYACRSGGKLEGHAGGGDVERIAWYWDNSDGKTHPVGAKEPNGLGLYDMSGNVWEWCEDLYNKEAYTVHDHNNPVHTMDGNLRVIRGGGWFNKPWGVRCALRGYLSPNVRYFSLGFRVVSTY